MKAAGAFGGLPRELRHNMPPIYSSYSETQLRYCFGPSQRNDPCRQSCRRGLLSNARRSDGGFQGKVAELDFSSKCISEKDGNPTLQRHPGTPTVGLRQKSTFA
jgi:hypothetical protein